MSKMPERTLTITDSFMFGRVMRDEGICKGLLERVLGFPVERIVYQNAGQVIDLLPDAKGVQLDLYVKDDERVYNVEVQVRKRAEPPRRLRYYQSVIDTDLLPKGASSYSELRDSYVIFLCAHDPFDDGIPVYTIERTCLENGRVIETGAHWLAFNCRAYARAESEGLRNLLEYLENGRVADDDDLLHAMKDAVTRANADREWVSKVRGVMTIYDDARIQGLIEGKAEGRAEGRAEGLAEGRAEGEARLSALIGKLLSGDRIGDIERVATDASYRDALFEEFKL